MAIDVAKVKNLPSAFSDAFGFFPFGSFAPFSRPFGSLAEARVSDSGSELLTAFGVDYLRLGKWITIQLPSRLRFTPIVYDDGYLTGCEHLVTRFIACLLQLGDHLRVALHQVAQVGNGRFFVLGEREIESRQFTFGIRADFESRFVHRSNGLM